MPALRARIGGTWVDVGGGGGTDEVWIGTDAPIDTATELWYDTDAVNLADPNTARWNSAWGVIAKARSASGSTSLAAGAAMTVLTTQAAVTLLAGRRYRITYNARAIMATGGLSASLQFVLYSSGASPGWFDQWRTAAMSNNAGYDGAIVYAVVDGDGVARLLDVRSSGNAYVPVTIYDDAYTGLIVEDVGPVSQASNPPAAPVSVWTPVTFQNGWRDLGGGWAGGAYRLVGDVVQLRGLVSNPAVLSASVFYVMFTLPAGFRPPSATNVIFGANCAGPSGGGEGQVRIQIESTGAVQIISSSPATQYAHTYTSLSGIQFSVTA